ncbi:uncharacterized protein LOC119101244 [Pollicipes pollicipes]|uniref:uncharacterized protein LOC119101244 n=1 Tax=Pollicipes pollicipes TaxID=41117 RepID=UPI0018853A76|nr:uncharacterized protein LOC119101244 [Pollicipes pollicipes]XP_037080442.1 uncharacterized protein LOC119101244 [Pollicipes pollicipes]
MWKQATVALLLVVVVVPTAEADASTYGHHATPYKQPAYYPSRYHQYPYTADRVSAVDNFFKDGLADIGLKMVILLAVSYVAFSIIASLGVLADNERRGLPVAGLDTIDALERLQKAFDTFSGH